MDHPFPAYRGDEPYVFVCYAHDDNGVVFPEIQWLHDQDVHVWYDEGISAGKVWRAEIAEAIQGAAKFLYYISAASLASEHCNREVNYALDRGFEVLPVYLEEVDLTPELDLVLNRVQALHRNQDASYQQHLLQALGQSTAIERPPVGPKKKGSGRRTRGVRLGAVVVFTILLGAGAITWYVQPREQFDELAEDALSPIRSIAVLPLENLSGDPEQGYFADGMTVTLIGELAQIGALRVISRTSVMQYKDTRLLLPEIARELNVQGVIVGSVAHAGDRVRISLQLIDARGDHHLWVETYERDLRDVLALQGEIARSVARAVEAELTPGEEARLRAARVIDPAAHEAYLRGTLHLAQVSVQDAYKAIEYFERAIEHDAEYAAAYLGLAEAYRFLGAGLAALPATEAAAKGRAAAERALDLDDSLGRAHATLGAYLHFYEWQWAEAEEAFQRAVELSPGDPVVNEFYGEYLSAAGRYEEALRFHQKAVDADPLDLQLRTAMATSLLHARDYERAVDEYVQILDVNPRFLLAIYGLANAYLMLGRDQDAFDSIMEAHQVMGQDEQWLERFELAYREAGIPGAARYWVSAWTERMKTEYVDPIDLANIIVYTGDIDTTFYWLERGYEARSARMTLLASWPPYDPLRSDPRFQDLLARIGFPQASRSE